MELGERSRAHSGPGALSPHPRAEDGPQLPLGAGLLVPAGLPLTPAHHSLAGRHILTAAMFDKEQVTMSSYHRVPIHISSRWCFVITSSHTQM